MSLLLERGQVIIIVVVFLRKWLPDTKLLDWAIQQTLDVYLAGWGGRGAGCSKLITQPLLDPQNHIV